MNLINLREFIKYHLYHICTFAYLAGVTQDLLEAALRGEENLTPGELRKITKYTGIPYSLMSCPRLIMMSHDRYRHRRMMAALCDKMIAVMEAAKGEATAGYITYKRDKMLNLVSDFQNIGEVSYCRYLGIKEEVEACLTSIACENREPRKRINA